MASLNPKLSDLSLKELSLNTRGLNTPEKRSQLLANMRSSKADVVFLQETHFCSKNIPNLKNHSFPHSYHATSPISKSKGVSILLPKNVPLQIKDTLLDDKGRFIFLKGTIRNRPITLANIYSPNTAQIPFFREITRHPLSRKVS